MLLIQNWFEIFNKSRTSMKSCKLDKNRINYVSGLYIVYYNYNNLHCVKVSYCIAIFEVQLWHKSLTGKILTNGARMKFYVTN